MDHKSIILIVDDEAFGRKTLEVLLNDPDNILAFACNGAEALAQAISLTPDLILLDVVMPDMDGFDVCRRLRADPRLAEVPVIMVTALDDRTSRIKGIEAGADDLVSKPYDSVELRTRVRTITRLNRYRRLLNERAKFERITELAPDGIGIIDSTNMIRLVNPALLRMLASDTADALIGTDIQHIIAPDHAPHITHWLATIRTESTAASCETICVRSNGEHFPVEVNAGYVNWDNHPAVQIIVRDITSRKKAEAALRESEKHLRRSRDALRALFDGLDDSLALLDSDGCLLAINQAMSQILGQPPTSIVSQPWATLCQSTTPAFPGQSALKTLRDGRARRLREHYTSSNGQTRTFDVQTLPLIGPEHTVDQVIIHVIDVTERLQMEALVIQNEHFAARGRMAASIAHEVNTPLQSIQNCLYLAGKAHAKQRDAYLNLASEELERISTIVRQLLNVHDPKDDSPASRINLNTLLERILMLTGGSLANHGIEVQQTLVANPPLFYGHADHLSQVFLNIIMNAIDAMPDGGTLSIQTSIAHNNDSKSNNTGTQRDKTYQSQTIGHPIYQESTAGSLLVTHEGPSFIIHISDTGSGINPDVQAHMFEPFFTTKPQGTGVGLSISQRIIANHNGHIKVQSTRGIGTTFTIALPLRTTSEGMA